jgi:hypothetical protein
LNRKLIKFEILKPLESSLKSTDEFKYGLQKVLARI